MNCLAEDFRGDNYTPYVTKNLDNDLAHFKFAAKNGDEIACVWLGIFYTKNGHYEQGRLWMQKAAEIQSKSPYVRFARNWLKKHDELSVILREQPNWDDGSLIAKENESGMNDYLFEEDFHRLLDSLARKDEKMLAILKNLMGEVDYCDEDFMIHF